MGSKQSKNDETTTDAAAGTQSKPIELEAMHVDDPEPGQTNQLRRRFFKGFTYSLNDPRSPSVLNRTPIVVEGNDRTLNLEDTFSDLFVACRTPVKPKKTKMISSNEEDMKEQDQNGIDEFLSLDCKDLEKSRPSSDEAANESTSIEFSSFIEEETMPCPARLHQTPLILQQSLDPRSPTIGLPRTPIVFDDDNDEKQEDAMLEEVLATLSIDLSSVSNSNSVGMESPLSVDTRKPVNKHLDRVRAVKKPKKPIRKSKHAAQKQNIYLDSENSNLTPTKRKLSSVETEKRTPLSCVKNRAHLRSRSRSVDSNGKSPKLRLSLTSYDDSLNPVQNRKVVNMHAMQGESFDL